MKHVIASAIIVCGLVATAAFREPAQSSSSSTGADFVITNVRIFDGERAHRNM
jgi:hypothetical protein